MAVIITISGDGLSYKKDINFKKAGQIITFLSLDEEQGAIGSPQIISSNSGLAVSSLRSSSELINESKARTNAQKITVIGSYLQEKDGQESFLVKEVLLQLKKIGEQPANFSRDVDTAHSLQYIYPIDVKQGKYGVSDKGEKAISNKFSELPVIRAKNKSKGGFKKAILPRDQVLSLPIVTSLEGYPDFHSILLTKTDSILWILAYAAKEKIESLTPREVEALSDKLLKKIEQKGFSAHNKRNMKEGYVSQTDGKFKLQQKGSDYLKGLDIKKNDKQE